MLPFILFDRGVIIMSDFNEPRRCIMLENLCVSRRFIRAGMQCE